jgi:hypothetical protein
MQALNERERFIVRERKLRDDPRTLESLGDELGLSKERVRQLEAAAFAKMRKIHAPLGILAVLFGVTLLTQLPMDGLSTAPLGIAERAADGFVGAGTGAPVTHIAFAN